MLSIPEAVPAHEPKPRLLAPNFDGIPDELKQFAGQYVLWRLERTNGRWTKVPRQHDGRKASVSRSQTWVDFDVAVAAYENGEFDGVGIVLTKELGLVGLDFDHFTVEQARPYLFQGYAELSPSGKGLRQFIYGQKPRGAKCSFTLGGGQKFEMYDRARFLTITGHRV
ncbi:hypothetical protein R0137_11005 [Congregibacter brevis]|uniref:DNA primase/polymerase bifunctional N-terminal domain-containing protein n=1 Tax=Congregibacter brevis TaxID=3081201 RepID=A0ABZ0I9G8_9GAMM|nr:hypothetical protein R0137_11005 [Congregibacter sp. IMCC45268]